MLLESLNAMILAADEALQETCGLDTVSHRVSVVRPGVMAFPAVAELRLQGAPLQRVYLGCDSLLGGQLAGLDGIDGHASGVDGFSSQFLEHLLAEIEARASRGQIHSLDPTTVSLTVRGVRSFGLCLDTGAGQLFVLAEVPSRVEYELARGSGYLAAMEAAYLPPEWAARQALDGQIAMDNFLVLLRKAEGDVYFEVPGGEGDTHTVHSGVLLDNATFEGVRGLKFCTDLSEVVQSGLVKGDMVRASVGIDDRSLEFHLQYLGSATHPLANGAELPCAFFLPPNQVTIAQRRLAFRIDVSEEVPVVLTCGVRSSEPSPWGDVPLVEDQGFRGILADLSFSGARVIADPGQDNYSFEINRRVTCEIYFPELEYTVSVLGVVRRLNSRLVKRGEREAEIGLEFLVGGESDRESLDRIRQYVLSEQRARLAKRVHSL